MGEDKEVTRRWVLVGIGVLLNGAVALLIATPIVGYLLGPVRKKGGYDSWIDLGEVGQFPVGETRLASFVNPQSMPWDGAPPKRPVGCAARRSRSFRSSLSTARTLAARSVGFRSPNFSCAPAMAVFTMAMARVPRAHRRAGFSNIPTKCRSGKLMIDGGSDADLGNHCFGAERELRMHG